VCGTRATTSTAVSDSVGDVSNNFDCLGGHRQVRALLRTQPVEILNVVTFLTKIGDLHEGDEQKKGQIVLLSFSGPPL
jgi:hypothetical protein